MIRCDCILQCSASDTSTIIRDVLNLGIAIHRSIKYFSSPQSATENPPPLRDSPSLSLLARASHSQLTVVVVVVLNLCALSNSPWYHSVTPFRLKRVFSTHLLFPSPQHCARHLHYQLGTLPRGTPPLLVPTRPRLRSLSEFTSINSTVLSLQPLLGFFIDSNAHCFAQFKDKFSLLVRLQSRQARVNQESRRS